MSVQCEARDSIERSFSSKLISAWSLIVTEGENGMRIDDDKLRTGKGHTLRRRMLQKRRSALRKRNCFSQLSQRAIVMHVLGRERAAVEQPKIDSLIPDTSLNNGEVRTVLRAGNGESAIAQRQVIAGMERDRRFYTEDDGSAAERGEIVGFIRNRRDPDGGAAVWQRTDRDSSHSLRCNRRAGNARGKPESRRSTRERW